MMATRHVPSANPASANLARPLDYALLLLLATLWGASFTLIRIGVTTIPPITFITARTLVAGLLLAVLMRLRGVAWPRDPVDWGRLAVQALLNSVFPFTLIAWAERSVPAGLTTILNAATPIFAFLIGWLVLRRERATWRKSIGVTLGLIGVAGVVGVEALSDLGQELLPQAAILFASLCYAGALHFGRNFSRHDPLVPAAGSMLVGGLLLTPASLAIDQPWHLVPSAASLGALAALTVGSTALAFVIYFRLLRVLGPVGISAQSYLRTPIGVGIGTLWLGETLPPSALAGCLAVVAGVVAMSWPARPVPAARAEPVPGKPA